VYASVHHHFCLTPAQRCDCRQIAQTYLCLYLAGSEVSPLTFDLFVHGLNDMSIMNSALEDLNKPLSLLPDPEGSLEDLLSKGPS